MADVTVTLAHFYEGKAPGDTLRVDAGLAKQLYRAGIARNETKGDEKALTQAVKHAPKVDGGS